MIRSLIIICFALSLFGKEIPIIKTGNNHIVFFLLDTDIDIKGESISNGDRIYCGYSDGDSIKYCGLTTYDSSKNQAMAVWGDNLETEIKDGIAIGEQFQWFLAKGDNWYEMEATYRERSKLISDLEIYRVDGISSVKSLKVKDED